MVTGEGHINILRCATVLVSDLACATAAYAEGFDYRVVEEGAIDAALAAGWGAPATAGCAFSLLQPASGAECFIRLIASDMLPPLVPFRTHGWQAMEICVVDVHATDARMARSPFTIVGPPAAIGDLPTIYPMQVAGPDGELSFLTEIKALEPNNGLPRAAAPIDHIFIMVLGCSDPDRTYDWFDAQLGIEPRMTLDIEYGFVARAFDLPPGAITRMRTAKANGLVCFEFDGLPPEAEPRPRAPGGLPAGIAMVTVDHPDLDAVPGRWVAPPAIRPGLLYNGARAGLLEGPDGVLLEMVERAALP